MKRFLVEPQDRQQHLEDVNFLHENVTSGVPCSVLAPVTLLRHVHYVPDGLSSYTDMFADNVMIMKQTVSVNYKEIG